MSQSQNLLSAAQSALGEAPTSGSCSSTQFVPSIDEIKVSGGPPSAINFPAAYATLTHGMAPAETLVCQMLPSLETAIVPSYATATKMPLPYVTPMKDVVPRI